MGSPLCTTLVNAFLCHYENIWLNGCPSQFKLLIMILTIILDTYKIGLVHTLLFWFFKICSNIENFHLEVELLRSIFKCNSYSLTLNFMAPFFYGWGSTASRLQPLRGGSLLFTTQFPEISGTHFINLGRMKG